MAGPLTGRPGARQDRSTSLLLLLAGSLTLSVEALFTIPDFLEHGQCANVTLVKNFDPVKYGGVWFNMASVPNDYEQTKACTTQNYTWMGEYMDVRAKGLTAAGKKVRQDLIFLKEDELRYPPDPAHMRVIVESMPESPYQVIATDYRRFSCVYSCLEYFGFRAEFTWLLSRAPTLSENDANQCYSRLASMGIDHTKMVSVTHGESCPYYKKLDQMLEFNRLLLEKTLGPESTTEANQAVSTATTTSTTTTPLPANPPTTTMSTPTPIPATTQQLNTTSTSAPSTAYPPTTTAFPETTIPSTPTVQTSTAPSTPTIKTTTAPSTPTVQTTTAPSTPTIKTTTAPSTPTVQTTTAPSTPTVQTTTITRVFANPATLIASTTGNVGATHDTGNVGAAHHTGGVRVAHDTGSVGGAHDTGSVGPAHDTGGVGAAHDTGSVGTAHDTGSVGTAHDTGSMETAHDTGSVGTAHDTGSVGAAHDMLTEVSAEIGLAEDVKPTREENADSRGTQSILPGDEEWRVSEQARRWESHSSADTIVPAMLSLLLALATSLVLH